MRNRSLTPKPSWLDAFTFFFIEMAILFEYVLWVCDTLGSSISAKLLEIEPRLCTYMYFRGATANLSQTRPNILPQFFLTCCFL